MANLTHTHISPGPIMDQLLAEESFRILDFVQPDDVFTPENLNGQFSSVGTLCLPNSHGAYMTPFMLVEGKDDAICEISFHNRGMSFDVFEFKDGAFTKRTIAKEGSFVVKSRVWFAFKSNFQIALFYSFGGHGKLVIDNRERQD